MDLLVIAEHILQINDFISVEIWDYVYFSNVYLYSMLYIAMDLLEMIEWKGTGNIYNVQQHFKFALLWLINNVMDVIIS